MGPKAKLGVGIEEWFGPHLSTTVYVGTEESHYFETLLGRGWVC